MGDNVGSHMLTPGAGDGASYPIAGHNSVSAVVSPKGCPATATIGVSDELYTSKSTVSPGPSALFVSADQLTTLVVSMVVNPLR